MFKKKTKDDQGSILIVCFFVLVLLSAFALTVGYMMRQKLQVIIRVDDRQKLRFLGDAAVKKSIYVLLKHRKNPQSFDALNQSWSQNESEFKEIKMGNGVFSVAQWVNTYNSKTKKIETGQRYGLLDEESKININRMQSPEVLSRLFVEVGSVTPRVADDLAKAIMNWKGKTKNTFEDGYYADLKPPYTSRHDAFTTLQELQWIKGMTAEIYEKILPYVTLHSTGHINLNTASRPVLIALGMAPSICDKLLAYRNWHDGLEGTSDDRVIMNLSSFPQDLANSSFLDHNEELNIKAVIDSGVLTIKSQNFSVCVLAQLLHKRQTLRLKAIFDDRGVIKQWEEEFVVLPS